MMNVKKRTSKRIKALISSFLLIALALTVLAACGGEEETSDNQNASSIASVDVSEAESSNAEGEQSKESSIYTESNTSESTENSEATSEDVSESGSESSSESESSEVEQSEHVDESSAPEDESSEPEIEIIGEGTKESPYLVFPNEDMTLTTYEIPADATHYYGIYRVGGLELTVDSEDLYIVCDGEKYTPKNGKLSFRVINAMASDAIVFEITNASTEPQAFEMSFANPVGTYANPVSVKMGDEYEISLPENEEVGYYYKYIAEKDGTVRFKLTASKDGFMAVTNNRNSAQRTSEEDGSTDDDGAKYVEIEVLKGDELIINVGAIPNKRNKRPAIDITIVGEYK